MQGLEQCDSPHDADVELILVPLFLALVLRSSYEFFSWETKPVSLDARVGYDTQTLSSTLLQSLSHSEMRVLFPTNSNLGLGFAINARPNSQ